MAKLRIMAKRRLEFDEALYRALRDYQIDAIVTNSTCVGALDQKLTAVYDRVRKAADNLMPTRKSK